ncbi:P-type ATPase [Artemisia annua]|uniref:P-type ATPase n=1 Tax=Artemisia annua TaxID=35608 RepID=A0A2U1LDP4_ARTAN|nr:P-type ATPase [Artemisia annua]
MSFSGLILFIVALSSVCLGWAGVIWLYKIVFYIPLDLIKFFIRYAISGRAWDLVIDQRYVERNNHNKLNQMAEDAKRRT